MIAATAVANDLPLYTCNPDDFEEIEGLAVVPVDLALRKLVGEPMSHEEMLAMEGAGWGGDLEQIRSRQEIPEP